MSNFIADTARIGKECTLGHNVVILDNVQIGNPVVSGVKIVGLASEMFKGKKIVTGTWHTDSGKVTSQNITSTDLKSGKVRVTNVSGGKLLP
jgi:UDP-3-O-[3-hydroxymyristoyl] glucosamine N-acyltransferase